MAGRNRQHNFGISQEAGRGLSIIPRYSLLPCPPNPGYGQLQGKYMSVRTYSLHYPVPWINGGGLIASAGFAATENKGIAFGGDTI